MKSYKKYIPVILVIVLLAGLAFYQGNVSQNAVVTEPKPGATVGPNFIVKGKAPSDWFSDNLTTITVTTADGDILLTGGATVDKGTTENGLTEFSLGVNLMGPGDFAGPYDGPATLTIEPGYQNVLTQIGSIYDTSDLDARLKNNTVRSSVEINIPLILKSKP